MTAIHNSDLNVLAQLVPPEVRTSSLAGIRGEDSTVMAIDPQFDLLYVAKCAHNPRLPQNDIQHARWTAQFLKTPLACACIEGGFSHTPIGHIWISPRTVPLTHFMTPGIADQCKDFVFEMMAQKIALTMQCAHRMILPDFDIRNVGVNSETGRLELFDFASIRGQIALTNLTQRKAWSLVEEYRALKDIDISKFHQLDSLTAYRATRFTDCVNTGRAFIPEGADLPSNDPNAQTLWNMYKRYEAQATLRINATSIPENPRYETDKARLAVDCTKNAEKILESFRVTALSRPEIAAIATNEPLELRFYN